MSLCTTSAQGVACRWTHYQQSLYARALPKSAAAGDRGAPICSQAARWWLAHHMVGRGRGRGPRTRAWPAPAARPNSGWTASSQGSVGGAVIPLGSRAASRAVRCIRGGVCLFRHRTAHKARRRTRLTTSCRGGCRGLAELGFEFLGARGGSQLPAHASETGPKRPATRRGGTRPTGVQYFSARGEKCARLSCTHAAV